MVPVIPRQRMSEDEYFELLEATGERLEYVAGVVDGMSGETQAHNEIESNLFGQIFIRLTNTGCVALTPNQLIHVASQDSYRFADLSVVCGKTEYVLRRSIGCLTNPGVVVEVLSARTSMKDESDKLYAYTSMKSVREYLIVFSDRYFVKLHERRSPDEVWKTTMYKDLDEEFELKSCGVRLKVRDVYGPRVSFEPEF
jgi:Uma2 family endonuclease